VAWHGFWVPLTCALQSIRNMVLHHAGKLCVEASPNSKVAWISEELCIGCGICVKVSAVM